MSEDLNLQTQDVSGPLIRILDELSTFIVYEVHYAVGSPDCIASNGNLTRHGPSSEPNISSASQDIYRMLWCTKVHHRAHSSPTFVHIPNQVNSVYALPAYCLEFHVHIILPFTPRSFMSTDSFRFPHQMDRDSVVCIATRYGLDGQGIESRWGRDFPHLSRPALGTTQPYVQCVPGLSRG